MSPYAAGQLVTTSRRAVDFNTPGSQVTLQGTTLEFRKSGAKTLFSFPIAVAANDCILRGLK